MDNRRLLLALTVTGTLGLLVLLPPGGFAGEYHSGSTLVCFDCHTMHFSQQHQYDGTAGQGTPPLSTGPNANLLRAPGVSDLCLACHDGQTFAPDVLGTHTNSYVRQAGALSRLGGATPYEDWKGHTLDMNATPPGGVSTLTIACTQCHGAHGSASYRNLTGAVPVTYTKGEPYAGRNTTKDVWLRQWVKGDLVGNYSYDSVRFNEPNPLDGAYASFCQGCHVAFHGTVGDLKIGGNLDTGGFLRHPTAQVNIGAIAGGHSSVAQYNAGNKRVHVMSSAAADYFASPGAGTFTVGDGLTPSCFSCHKAHGNQNAFGLIFLARDSATVTEEGTPGVAPAAGMRNLCGQCHLQGN